MTSPHRRAPRQSCPVLLGLPPSAAKPRGTNGSEVVVLRDRSGSGIAFMRREGKNKALRGMGSDPGVISLALPTSRETVGDARRLSASGQGERRRLGSVPEVEDSENRRKKDNG